MIYVILFRGRKWGMGAYWQNDIIRNKDEQEEEKTEGRQIINMHPLVVKWIE